MKFSEDIANKKTQIRASDGQVVIPPVSAKEEDKENIYEKNQERVEILITNITL